MKWADIVISKLEGSSFAVTPEGEPFVSLPVPSPFKIVGNKETVQLFFRTDTDELPFSIWFRHNDSEGDVIEERLYATAGTRDLAISLMKEVRDLRANSYPVVLVEDGE